MSLRPFIHVRLFGTTAVTTVKVSHIVTITPHSAHEDQCILALSDGQEIHLGQSATEVEDLCSTTGTAR